MPAKRLHKIKLEDVIAILSLSLFLAEVINVLHRIVTTHLFEGFKQKKFISLYLLLETL